MELNHEDITELEKLVDKYTLSDVVTALAAISWAKADHIAYNWQDSATAKAWRKDEAMLANIASKLFNK